MSAGRAGWVLVVTAMTAALHVAAPTAGDQTLRANVEIVPIEAVVRDGDGLPVRGLTAEDFEVRLNGARAAVRVVEYVDLVRSGPSGSPAPPSPQRAPVLMPARGAVGRSILVGMDDLSFRGLEAQPLVADVAAWVGSLPSSDYVGLMTSSGGAGVPLTRDRGSVAAGLRGAAAGRKASPPRSRVQLSLREAVAIDENAPIDFKAFGTLEANRSLPYSVISPWQRWARECPWSGADCFREFRVTAQAMAHDAIANRGPSLDAYASFLRTLRSAPAPRVLVLVSRGLHLESSEPLRDVAAAAAEVGAIVFALVPSAFSGAGGQADQATVVAAKFMREDNEHLAAGLDRLASATHGTVHRVAVGADRMLAAVTAGTSGLYRLGVELPEQVRAADLDVQVGVARRGVRAITAAKVTRTAAVAGAAEPAPAASSSLDIAMGTAIRRDETGGQLFAVISASAPAAAAGPVNARLDFISSSTGQTVRSGTVELPAPAGRTTHGTFGIPVPPGRYRLRVTLTDASGAAGSSEREVVARLRPFGSMFGSDVLIAWRGADKVSHAWALEEIPQEATTLVVRHELYASGETTPDSPSERVTITSAAGDVVVSRDMAVQRIATRFASSVEIPIADLPPGDYQVAVEIRSGSAVIGSATANVRTRAR